MTVTDRDVAVEVMGLVETAVHAHQAWKFPDGSMLWFIPSYTESVSYAMKVVAQMESDGWVWSLSGKTGESTTAAFVRNNGQWLVGRSEGPLPQAICEAAVAAKRAEREAQ